MNRIKILQVFIIYTLTKYHCSIILIIISIDNYQSARRVFTSRIMIEIVVHQQEKEALYKLHVVIEYLNSKMK